MNYLTRDKTEKCFMHKRNEDFKQDDIILEITNSLNENKNLINCEFIFSILNISPITIRNVVLYNNLAFALEQLVKYNESIYLLQKVLKKFPNRTVAYINLGDAYWGLKENSKAKQAYQKYIELMKASGKESKIPKRVFERVKE
jgi:tetratricopeptide (TPR) repeat protein